MSGEMAVRIWRNKNSWVGFRNIIRNPVVLSGSLHKAILQNKINLDKEMEIVRNKLKKINGR